MDQPDRTDRTRLKEVHASDLTEGRINEDFVDWLKTKGMTWLLVVLVALCGYFGFVRWRSHQTGYRSEAWSQLNSASLPGSLEEIADKYADVDAVSLLARLRAGSMLLSAVQTGKELGPADATGAARADLTEQQRTDYLDRADRLYGKVLDADDASIGKTLLMVAALNGRAAVAESQGKTEVARQHYESAASRAQAHFPALAADARERAESADLAAAPSTLLTQAQLSQLLAPRATADPREPATVEPWIRDLVMPR